MRVCNPDPWPVPPFAPPLLGEGGEGQRQRERSAATWDARKELLTLAV
jgi:hypothetical protein